METLNNWPSLSPISVLRTMWKRKSLILLVWALAGGLAMAIVFALPVVYRAQTVILVESQRIPERFVSSTVSADLNDRVSTLRQQILSYSRLLTIVNKYGLYKDKRRSKAEEEIIDMMRTDTSVQLERGWSQDQPGAFKIAYESRDPAVAAQVANELAELFIDQNLRSREVNAVGTTEFLQDQLAEAKQRLVEQEVQITEYKRSHNGELPQQETALVTSLSRLQMQLQNVQEQISRAQQNKTLRESELETALSSQASIQQMAEASPGTNLEGPGPAPVEKESVRLERQLAALRARYTGSHPDVKTLSDAIALAKENEASEATGAVVRAPAEPKQDAAVQSVSKSGRLLMNGTLLRERERVEQLKTFQGLAVKQLEDLEAERGRALRELGSVQARIQQLPLREQQIAGLLRDYESSKTNYQSLLNKKLAAQMASEMEKNQKSERFTVLDSARVPEKPVSPDRPLLSVGGWIGGLILALAAGFALELRKNVILGEWELPAGTPVLGRVPRIELRDGGPKPALGRVA